MGQRTIAGVFEPGGISEPAAARREIHRAISTPPERVVISGALAVGFTGPPPSRQGSIVCVADTELYEAPEVNRSREPPHDDERALAAAYSRRGAEALAGLRGGFAAVLWDERARRGALARDHFGRRPLVVCRRGRRLLFASEVRELLRMLPGRPDPDDVSVVHWLALGVLPAGRTPYSGIAPLRPAHLLPLDEEIRAQRPYWTPIYRTPEHVTLTEAAGVARAHLARAVRRRLPGDGRVGVLLGGGIDAATVAAIARDQYPSRAIGAYSALFPEHPSVDESSLIPLVTGALGLSGIRMDVGSGSLVRAAISFQDEWEMPLVAVTHAFMRPLVERAGADGVEVVLDGEGGDELFGLSPYLLADLVARGRLLQAIALAAQLLGPDPRPSLRQALRAVRFWGVGAALPPAVHRALRRPTDPSRGASRWLSPRSRGLLDASLDDLEWRGGDGPRWWSWMAWTLTRGRERVGMLDYLRRRAAGTGVRPAHPLLDDVDLVEGLLSLPPELAFDPRHNRPVARAITRGELPDALRLRAPKTTWNEVRDDCLGRVDRPWITRLLSQPGALVLSYAAREPLRALLEGDGSHGRAWPGDAWRLLTTELWLRAQAGDEVLSVAPPSPACSYFLPP